MSNNKIMFQAKPVANIEQISWLVAADSRIIASNNIKHIDNDVRNVFKFNRNEDLPSLLCRMINNNQSGKNGVAFVNPISQIKIGQYSLFNFTNQNVYVKDRTDLVIPCLPIGARHNVIINQLFQNEDTLNIKLSNHVLVIKNITFPNHDAFQLDEIFRYLSEQSVSGKLKSNYDLSELYEGLRKEIEQSTYRTNRNNINVNLSRKDINIYVCYLVKANDIVNMKTIDGIIDNHQAKHIGTDKIYKFGVYYPQLDLVLAQAPNIHSVIDHPMSQPSLNLYGFSESHSTLDDIDYGTPIVGNTYEQYKDINQITYAVFSKQENVSYYRYNKDLNKISTLNSLKTNESTEYLEIFRNMYLDEVIDETNPNIKLYKNKIIERIPLDLAIENKIIFNSKENTIAHKRYSENNVQTLQLTNDTDKALANQKTAEQNTLALYERQQLAILETEQLKIKNLYSERESAFKQLALEDQRNYEKQMNSLSLLNLSRKEENDKINYQRDQRLNNQEYTVNTLKIGVAVLTTVGGGILAYNKLK